jgi:hypothetical protein
MPAQNLLRPPAPVLALPPVRVTELACRELASSLTARHVLALHLPFFPAVEVLRLATNTNPAWEKLGLC